jgi:hypothetical protein
MRGMVKRHFVGENAAAYAQHSGEGWQTRWLEVDNQGVLTVAEDASFLRVLARVQIYGEIVARALDSAQVPEGRQHCFTIENLGVDIALDAATKENCAKWLEKMRLHQQESRHAGASAPGGEHWRRVGLTQTVVPTLRALLRRLAVPEFDDRVPRLE